MTQAELFKALRGESRTEVDLSLGQVPVSPTIQSGGKYTVVVPPVSRQNSATRLSAVLAQVPQVTGQFKNIQQQAGVREANELTPDEVIRKVEEGDVEAQGLLASFGKEKTFQEQLYSRYFTSTLQPGFTKVESEMRNLTPRQIAEIGDVRSYVQQKLVDSIDPDVFNTIKDPNNRFMAQRHNLAMEALIPKVVEGVVGSAERKKQDYAIDEAVNNAAGTLANPNNLTLELPSLEELAEEPMVDPESGVSMVEGAIGGVLPPREEAEPSLAVAVEVEAANLASLGVGQTDINKTIASGVSQRAETLRVEGNIEEMRNLQEALDSEVIKVGGKPFINTYQGRALSTQILKSIEDEEDKIDREESKILAQSSKKFRNETNAQGRAIVAGLSEDPTEEEQEEALNSLAELEQSIVTAQQNNQVDAVTANALAATISSFENDIKNKTVRLNSEMAVARETYMRASGGIPTDVAKTFSAPTAKSLAVYEDVFGTEFIEQNKVFNTGLGKTQYTDFLTYEMDLIAKDALVATVNQLMPTLDPKDPEFKTKFEEAFESKLRSNLEKDKIRMEEASSAHVDPSALSASEQVRNFLNQKGLALTPSNIEFAQEELLKDSPRSSLLDATYNYNPESLKFLRGQRYLKEVNKLVDNDVLLDRANLPPSVMAEISQAGSNKAVSLSYFSDISKTLSNTSDPVRRRQIRQNYIQSDVRFTGLPVDVLEGSMVVTKIIKDDRGSTYDPFGGGKPSVNVPFTLDFDAADNYFKRYNQRIISSEAVVAYDNGNTSLMDRAFAAGVSKGQLNEGQRQDFIDEQLRIGRDIGIIKPLSQNNEQE